MSVCSSAKAFLTKKKEMPVRGNAGKNDALIALIFTVFTTAIAKQRVQAQGSLDFRETQYFTFELWQKNTEYHLPLRLHLPFSPHFFYRGDSKLAPAVCGSSQHEAAGECRLIGSIPTSVSSSGPLPSTPILPARLSLAALGENPVILHRPKTITGAAAVSPPHIIPLPIPCGWCAHLNPGCSETVLRLLMTQTLIFCFSNPAESLISVPIEEVSVQL